jgi:hypothetical protein
MSALVLSGLGALGHEAQIGGPKELAIMFARQPAPRLASERSDSLVVSPSWGNDSRSWQALNRLHGRVFTAKLGLSASGSASCGDGRPSRPQ